MQLIVPMTGLGARFAAAGYTTLKPFILVHGKPIIYWVLKAFPGISSEKILFILREDHFKQLPYIKKTLNELAPNAKISLISEYDKRGPVPNILRSNAHISDTEPTFVTYCDYYMQWDFKKYCDILKNNNCEGAVPCYSGFHPNLIPEKNLYASCKVDADENLIEIKEKFSFDADKTKSRHSPGAYYFKNGALLKKYYQMSIDENLSINGEFYASLPYNLMVRDKLKVHAPINVDHFCQWGTPEDLSDYLSWINLVKRKNL